MHNICICQPELGKKKRQRMEIDSIVVSDGVNERLAGTDRKDLIIRNHNKCRVIV